MPRYFFHVIDDEDTADNEGAELPDVEAARRWAIAAARTLMCETLTQEGRITLHHRIDVEDEQHALVGSVPFAEAVEIVRL